MINRILGLLTGSQAPRPLPEADANHLMGALLLRLAHADDRMNLPELQAIDRFFVARLSLSPLDAARMRADCERLADFLPPTEELGPLIRRNIPPEQRFALREALLSVAEADGRIAPREAALLDQIGALLNEEAAVHNLQN